MRQLPQPAPTRQSITSTSRQQTDHLLPLLPAETLNLRQIPCDSQSRSHLFRHLSGTRPRAVRCGWARALDTSYLSEICGGVALVVTKVAARLKAQASATWRHRGPCSNWTSAQGSEETT